LLGARARRSSEIAWLIRLIRPQPRQYGAVKMSAESAEQNDHRVTELLLDWSEGDNESRERLMDLVYQELRRIAGAQLRGERRDHTMRWRPPRTAEVRSSTLAPS
jgi:hypothetical protein